MATIRKDDMPAGPGGEMNGDEAPEELIPGGGGADLVEIASERLTSICEAVDAAGGVLTPGLRSEVGNVIALLETVASDDDEDDEDEELAPEGPGEPTPMQASAKAKNARKAAARKGKVLMGRFRKMKLTPEAFVTKLAGLMLKAASTKNATLKKMRYSAIQKMLTYGPEQFGNTDFSETNASVPEIPMYVEEWQTVPVEEKTPSEEQPRSQYAYDPTYTSNENSQQAYVSGSPEFGQVGKRLDLVRSQLAKFAVVKAGPAGDANGVEEAPVQDDLEKHNMPAAGDTGAVTKEQPDMSSTGHNVEDDGSVPTSVEGAEWSTSMINDLPDGSFLYVEPGGKKDEDGRTTPRTLRHFPYKGQDGSVDLPHLRNALARIPQSGISGDEKSKLTAQAQSMLEEHTKSQKGEEESEIQKSLRSDDGWPDDLASDEFLKGEKMVKHLPFGRDALLAKEQAMEAAAAAAAQ